MEHLREELEQIGLLRQVRTPPPHLEQPFFQVVSEAVKNSAFIHTLFLMYVIHNPVLTQVTQIHNQSENMSLLVHYLHYELLKMSKTVHHFGRQMPICHHSRCSDERIRSLSFVSPFYCECWHRYPSQIYLSGVPETLLCHLYGSPEQTNTSEPDLQQLINRYFCPLRHPCGLLILEKNSIWFPQTPVGSCFSLNVGAGQLLEPLYCLTSSVDGRECALPDFKPTASGEGRSRF